MAIRSIKNGSHKTYLREEDGIILIPSCITVDAIIKDGPRKGKPMKIDKDRLYYSDRVGTPEENLAYHNGLEDAWDLARLIIFRDEDAREAFHDNPPESVFESLTAQKALYAIKQTNKSRVEKRIKELFDEYGVETVLEVGERLASDRN